MEAGSVYTDSVFLCFFRAISRFFYAVFEKNYIIIVNKP